MNPEIIKQYLNKNASETKNRLTIYYQSEINEISILLSKIMSPLQLYFTTINNPNLDDPKYHSYGLMTKGANTLMASIELVLNGYYWEPPILHRNAVEHFATGWDIIQSDDRFQTWKENKKFKSTDSLSNIKHDFPKLGNYYGMLSTMYTHVSPINSSPSFIFVDGGPKIQFFGQIREGKEGIRKSEIYVSIFVVYICLQITESCFSKYTNELETIRYDKNENNFKVKVSDRHRKFADECMKILKERMDMPLSDLL